MGFRKKEAKNNENLLDRSDILCFYLIFFPGAAGGCGQLWLVLRGPVFLFGSFGFKQTEAANETVGVKTNDGVRRG